jgi:hypothetical protein
MLIHHTPKEQPDFDQIKSDEIFASATTRSSDDAGQRKHPKEQLSIA